MFNFFKKISYCLLKGYTVLWKDLEVHLFVEEIQIANKCMKNTQHYYSLEKYKLKPQWDKHFTYLRSL